MLDALFKAFGEVMHDPLEVPMLKSDAYQGLLSVAEKRGDRACAKRYLRLARRERERQCSPQS